MKNTIFISLLAIPMLLSAHTGHNQVKQNNSINEQASKDFLQRFQKNPAQAIDEQPYKKQIQAQKRVIRKKQKDLSFIDYKDQVRQGFCTAHGNETYCLGDKEGRVPFGRAESPEYLVDNSDNVIDNLSDINDMKLRSAKLKSMPWSDDYWPIANGMLGFRYADPTVIEAQLRKNIDFKKSFKHHSENMQQTYLDAGSTIHLSPSEKYDLALGDYDFSLTKSMWQTGTKYLNEKDKVETWMGICHGWAAASYMLPHPRNSVTIVNNQGLSIVFYPADIKALGSLLWAEGKSGKTRFIGKRCNSKKPKKDEKSGRIIEEGCFDVNPGAWHITVVNQIGISKRSFIIDATFDYEVWNQPVVSYSYKYFHPIKKTYHRKWEKARVTYDNFKKHDPFVNIREPRLDESTKYIVGVIMEVTYSIETHPHVSLRSYKKDNAFTTVQYHYDLEVDKNGKVLGGEWYSNKHPDFLWTPAPDAKAISFSHAYTASAYNQAFKESLIEDEFIQINPSEDLSSGIKSLSNKGIPFSDFVNFLFEKSKKN